MEAAVFPQRGVLRGRRALKEEEEHEPWCGRAFGGQVVVVDGTSASFGGACSSSVPPETAAAANNGGCGGGPEALLTVAPAAAGGGVAVGRRKKRRRRNEKLKNEEEAENQRLNHITVERNRRKQMNNYLAVLQSLMPPSYAARGDQASIVGGAINFVKELEQLLQSLEARKRIERRSDVAAALSSAAKSSFFASGRGGRRGREEGVAAGQAFADDDVVEVVSIVERHANLKVVARRRRPKQLLRMVVGLQNLRLTPLHLNMTSVAQMAFYSFSLKVEDDCQLISMEDIASAVHRMVGNIQEDDEFIL